MRDEIVPSTPSTSSMRVQKASRTNRQRREKQALFLEAYRKHGIVKYACEAADVDRKTFYNWRDNDKAFQALLPDAKDDAIDTLEHAAFQQAVEGTLEPVVSMGKVVYDSEGEPLTVPKYSPQLLITLLKAGRPDKYKEKAHFEHTGRDSGPIEVANVTRETLENKLEAMRASMSVSVDEKPF